MAVPDQQNPVCLPTVYTFFWSGRKTEERREAGVGFAIKSDLVGKLTGLPNGINDRLMTLRLPLSGNKHATIVSAYAPTMTNPDEVKDKLYDDLDKIISATLRTDKLILLGDFNASWYRPPNLGRSDRLRRCRQMQQQWSPASKEMC